MTDQVAQLVDSSSNFRFLAEPGFVLAGDAALAESYVDSSPDVAMFLARRYSETLAKMLAQRVGLPLHRTQHERVQALADARAIPAQVRQLFDTVRLLGNAAVHESSHDRQKALRAVEACFELGVWWYQATTSNRPSGGLALHAAADPVAARRLVPLDRGAIAFIFGKEPYTLSSNGIPPYMDNGLDDAIRWARASGGVDAATTVLMITLQGRTEDAIVLTDFRIRVTQRRNPLPGYLVRIAWPTGGPVQLRAMEFDLDEAHPRIKMPDYRENAEQPSWSFPLKVSSTDPEYFYVLVGTSTCDCSWVAEIDYVLQGVAGTHVVDNNGVPFRTSGTAAVKASYVTSDGRRFAWCRAADVHGEC